MIDKEKHAKLKKRLQAKMAKTIKEDKKRYIKTEDLPNPPRYDDVYWEGVAWLDSL